MGLTDGLLSTWQILLTGLLFLLGLFMAFRDANWRRLRQEPALQHSFFGAAVVLGFLWQMRAGVAPGLSIHIFAMTTVTLMLGWGLAVFAGLIASAISVITGNEPLAMFPVNGFITVMLPALVSYLIVFWEREHGFKNFFAYIFFCGFFGAALSVAVAGSIMVGLLWFSGSYSWYELVHDYVRYMPLFILPEAIINGFVVASLMAFHPERLLTLDVRRYN